MSVREKSRPAPASRGSPFPLILDIYARALAAALMLLGFRQWAIILGLLAGGGGMFMTMSTPWQIATMHLAVVDLVAAVGLWMRVAWGNVLWLVAALSEIVLHTVFANIFGFEPLIVGFHLLTMAGYAMLWLLARRAVRT